MVENSEAFYRYFVPLFTKHEIKHTFNFVELNDVE